MTLRLAERARAALLAAVLGTVLAGCVAPPRQETPANETRDRITASDEPDATKRAHARMELASAYFGRGQMTTALDQVKQAIAADPLYGEAFNLRGLIYANLGDNVLAEESFKRALQLNARDADTMHNYGWYLCQQKRYAESNALFNQALAQPQYRGVARTLLAQGVCQAYAGQLAESEASLSRAYELDPTSPFTATNLSEVLYRRGEYERARFYIRRVNSQPDVANAQTLWLAARIENKLGNRQGASEFGAQLRNRFPDSREAAFSRGKRSMNEAAGAAAGPATSPSAGRMLREARERQGLHIAALAASIKVAPKKLELLEADRFDALPDATFTRALAQTVCRALKIDSAPMLGLLPPPLGHRLDHVGEGLNAPFRERPGTLVQRDGSSLTLSPVFWVTALILIAAVGLYFVPSGLLGMPHWRGAGAASAAGTRGAAGVATPRRPMRSFRPNPAASTAFDRRHRHDDRRHRPTERDAFGLGERRARAGAGRRSGERRDPVPGRGGVVGRGHRRAMAARSSRA